MLGSILHRMVLRELVKVFVLSLVGITGILVMAGIIAEARQQGLNPLQVLEIIPLLIPSTLPYTLPATTLFATCVVYGRLAADNEILAIKAAGINVLRVVWAGLLLGLLMSASTLGMSYQLIPWTYATMRSMFLGDAEESLYAVLQRDHSFNQPRVNYAMWVRQVQGKKLLGALFKRRDANDPSRYDVVALAREAELRVDMPRKLILLHMYNGQVIAGTGSSLHFDDRVFEVELPAAFSGERPRGPRELTWQELLARRGELEEMIREDEQQISAATARLLWHDAPPDLPQYRQNLVELREGHAGMLASVHVEMQMRPALSLGCLCFILVGCPVGIWFSRSDYLSSFITCFLPIVIVYYPLLLCCTGLARGDGKLFLVPLIWGADAVVGAVGLAFLWRLVRK